MNKKTRGRNATAMQNAYIAKTYDRINLLVPKGYKDKVKEAAGRSGSSVNAYITRALNEAIQRDAAACGDTAPACDTPAPARSARGSTDVPTPPRGAGG